MIVRDRKDGTAIIGTQEDHAELAAQFAAHWGNGEFAKLRPYESMVFATIVHDSGHREWETCPPVNTEKGRPLGHREMPFFPQQLEGYSRNVDWTRSRDPYAGLIVSMHRTGLWQSRYQTIKAPETARRRRERRPEVQAALERLEALQKIDREALGKNDRKFERELWVNYRLLQVYDLLSLYFCCDGFVDDRLAEQTIGPVPVGYDTPEEVDLRLIPKMSNALRITPYPFDVSPLTVSLRARVMSFEDFPSPEACREAYFKAPRCLLSFEITE